MFFSVGNVKVEDRRLWQMDKDNEYIVTCSGVYQIFYSSASQSFYGLQVVSKKGLEKRGKFAVMTAHKVNNLLGQEILIER